MPNSVFKKTEKSCKFTHSRHNLKSFYPKDVIIRRFRSGNYVTNVLFRQFPLVNGYYVIPRNHAAAYIKLSAKTYISNSEN